MKWLRRLLGAEGGGSSAEDDGSGMTEEAFWIFVGELKAESGDDLERREALYKERVAVLPLSALRDFSAHWTRATDCAYDWRLWAAAAVIQGGCSDDSFMDFRDTLITFGRDAFEAALRDPESLLALAEHHGRALFHEGFGYVTFEPWKALTGEDAPPRPQPHPAEPTGESWDEDNLEAVVPALWARFGRS